MENYIMYNGKKIPLSKETEEAINNATITYEDVCEKIMSKEHYFTRTDGKILESNMLPYNPNCAPTPYQLECLLARNKLINTAIYLNDGWVPSDELEHKFHIMPNMMVTACCEDLGHIYFKLPELAQEAKNILGEDTVRMALKSNF